jgi:glycosyltransferase involved in cell wall biosynthesis
MRILFLTHYFPPEIGAPQTRILETAIDFQAGRHEVFVLTTFPHYPDGRIPREYRRRAIMRESVQGVPVVRSWVLAGPNRGILRRTLDQASFAATALPAAALVPRPDVISVDIHPVFLCVTANVLARFWRVPYVVVAGDLHPEMAVDIGVLTNPLAIQIVRSLSQVACNGAAAIAPMTAGIERLLLARGIPPKKLALIHYGSDVALFEERSRWLPLPATLEERIRGRFVVSYIGTHGVSQGLQVVLDAAEKLRSHPEILFLMIGDGAQKASLRDAAETRGIENVLFWDRLPRPVIPSVYERSDACLVSLRRLRTFREGGLPSKLFEIMAAGRPAIVAAEGEPADMAGTAESGLVIPPEDPARLAAAVLDLMRRPEARRAMGERGRAYVKANYSRTAQSRKFEALLDRVVNDRR